MRWTLHYIKQNQKGLVLKTNEIKNIKPIDQIAQGHHFPRKGKFGQVHKRLWVFCRTISNLKYVSHEYINACITLNQKTIGESLFR